MYTICGQYLGTFLCRSGPGVPRTTCVPRAGQCVRDPTVTPLNARARGWGRNSLSWWGGGTRVSARPPFPAVRAQGPRILQLTTKCHGAAAVSATPQFWEGRRGVNRHVPRVSGATWHWGPGEPLHCTLYTIGKLHKPLQAARVGHGVDLSGPCPA